jgi:hypothetical protein
MAEKKKEKMAEIRSSLLSQDIKQTGSLAPRAGVTQYQAGGMTDTSQPGAGINRQWAPLPSQKQFGVRHLEGPIVRLKDKYDISTANIGKRGYQLYKLTER